MCRLLAYVHSGPEITMKDSLGASFLNQFRNLSTVHRDGWGAVWTHAKALSSYVSHKPACEDDQMFSALSAQSIDSAIVHFRWASPGIALLLDNQQPFVQRNIAFGHNGTISNDEGNIVKRPASYRESLGLFGSTTESDSGLYAELFFLHLAKLRALGRSEAGAPGVAEIQRSLSLSIALLRRDYPSAGFNAVIETEDFTFVVRAHPDKPRYSDGLIRGYEKAGWAGRIDGYYDIVYTSLSHADGSKSSVAASSGCAVSDSWTTLSNDSLLALSHADAGIQVLALNL